MEGREKGGWEAGGERLDRLQCVLSLEAEDPFPLACTPVFCSLLLPGCPVQGTCAELAGGVTC